MRSPLSCVVMTAPSGCGGDEGAEDGAVARADGELRVPLHAEAEAVAGRLDALDHAVGRQRVHHHARAGLLHRLVVRRSEEHTSELQSLMRISYAVFCLKKKKNNTTRH